MNMDGRLICPVSCPETIESSILIVPIGNLGISPRWEFFSGSCALVAPTRLSCRFFDKGIARRQIGSGSAVRLVTYTRGGYTCVGAQSS